MDAINLKDILMPVIIHRLQRFDDQSVNIVNENFKNIAQKLEQLADAIDRLEKKE